MMTIPALATALVYGVGGYLAIQGELTVGTLLALTALLFRLLGPMQGLSNVRIDVMTALVSFERVFEVLDLPSSISEKPDAVALPVTASRVEFDRVSFRYPRADEVSLASLESVARTETVDTGEVLHDISFTAEPGQMVALVGPSGAGKTTITHLVARLYDVGSGAVRVGGHDVRDVTLESLEDVVGYVTQDAHMFHDTIRTNLLYARPDADDRAVWAVARGGPGRRPGPRAARGPRHRRRRPRLPPLAAASVSGSPSPACCSRRRPSSCSTRPPHTSTPSPSTPSSAPSTQPSRAAPAWSSPTASPPSARPTRSWSSTRAASSSAAPTRACSPRAASTPTSTAPSS